MRIQQQKFGGKNREGYYNVLFAPYDEYSEAGYIIKNSEGSYLFHPEGGEITSMQLRSISDALNDFNKGVLINII